jgi:hypothetical protein
MATASSREAASRVSVADTPALFSICLASTSFTNISGLDGCLRHGSAGSLLIRPEDRLSPQISYYITYNITFKPARIFCGTEATFSASSVLAGSFSREIRWACYHNMKEHSCGTARSDGHGGYMPVRMSGGDAIVESLLLHGVDTVFGVPGVQLPH